jgi:hypothetical protein
MLKIYPRGGFWAILPFTALLISHSERPGNKNVRQKMPIED